ncbi:Multidrug resistance protein MdtC [Rosistilla oblonga]|uniref:efflux RND transporter permease subunit n=1 Tax=Rosistilla oblonga TaxID=2527990 RepID=UPI0011887E57|nr:efflux RND transporter permease subunit [Rosistilla oblonga]QDV14931.1 Multidrug resistance protein MdtC [Rosistilla oblonga]
MKSVIRWAITNSPGMNVIMLATMLLGAACFYGMRREVFPEFELEIVVVTVPYPGATPEDVEDGICQKIEEAVRSIEGIKKVTSIAQEGSGSVIMELQADVADVQKVLNEIDREVARIPSFPDLTEEPTVQQITFRTPAIRVAVVGPRTDDPDSELRLRSVVEDLRDDLLQLKTVSATSIMGAKPFQIDVEVSEEMLRKYGLSLKQIAAILRARNIELPGGQLKSDGQEVLLRAKNKGRFGDEIGRLPIITQSNGSVLTVNDIGTVRDAFEDLTSISEINGEPAMVVNVERTKSEDLLAMVREVREYVDRALPPEPHGVSRFQRLKKWLTRSSDADQDPEAEAADAEPKAGGLAPRLPPGYKLVVWGDTSQDVQDRLSLLIRNGASGLALVFLVLALFLELRLAFWVALGIPISILGAGCILWYGDKTLNMLSLFSFLVALGIVVDDAIIVGENIFAHRQQGKKRLRAAIDGAAEVLPSVTASVSTTVIAFSPMFFVSGVMGKFMAVIPFAVIAMLVISLLESLFVLPAHLAHEHSGFFRFLNVLLYPLRPIGMLLSAVGRRSSRGLEWFAEHVYLPVFKYALQFPTIPISIAIGMLIVTVGMVRGGIVQKNLFPKLDSNNVKATVVFPDGTPVAITDAATQKMEQAIRQVSAEIAAERSAAENKTPLELYPDSPLNMTGPVKLTFRQVGSMTTGGGAAEQTTSGSHAGQVLVELYDTNVRTTKSSDLLNRWRDAVGELPGAESVVFGTEDMGPGGAAIEFKLLAPADKMDALESATEAAKAQLASKEGVFDIRDDNTPGKWEFQFKVKEDALATGVTPTDLGETVRNAYYGAEVMRLQRGRNEVKLMVRYPKEQRSTLGNFNEIFVRTDSPNQMESVERPITELAELDIRRGFSEINRVDQRRSITITADIDETKANGSDIVAYLQREFEPTLQESFPGVSIRWEGQQEQSRESVGSLMIGFGVAMFCMFILLVLQFRSYFQPLLILAIIPFGMIGAVWGHALMGLPLSLFSMFGLVALAGVVVNDSIVLVDFINSRIRAGEPPVMALMESGQRRFRPVILTSFTTIAGLLPLLMERSFQAQLLIPMATSLAFGLLTATVLVLFMVPILYMLYLKMLERLGIPYTDHTATNLEIQTHPSTD